ncbi:MAG: hypothetical protein ACP5OU_09020 [Methanothrix sp.]
MKSVFLSIGRLISVLLPSMLILTFTASAHIPMMAGGNEDISNAMHISDPFKSWALYGSLQNDAVHYYSFEIEEGKLIQLSLFKSADMDEADFQPELLLMGPGLEDDIGAAGLPDLPGFASDFGLLRAEGMSAQAATYEPFGPSSFIELSLINITAPETAVYYAAVRSSVEASEKGESFWHRGGIGHYGLGLGFIEESSFSDRISTPIRLISVYIWEGQSIGVILVPYLVAVFVSLIFFWHGPRRTSFCLAGSLAGFLFLATSASVLNQMTFSLTRAPFGSQVYITLAIAVFHALIGVAAIRLARGEAGILQRALLAVLGTMALLAGSGMIIGPIFSMASSFLPSRTGSIFSRRSQPSIDE